jgi:hypothetical protein
MEEISSPAIFTITHVEKVEGEKDEEAKEHICFGQSGLEKKLITGKEDTPRNETGLGCPINPLPPKEKDDDTDPGRKGGRQPSKEWGH